MGEDARSLTYLPSGHILFQYQQTQPGIWILPVNPSTFAPTGSPFRVEAAGRFASVSNNGSLVFLGGNFPPRNLVIIDRQGRELKSHTLDDSIIGLPSLSPDASQMVVSSSGDLWIHDLTTGARRRFTFSPATEKAPTWSPSGRLIAFDSDENLVVESVDGGPERLIVRTNFRSGINARWSPDSSRLIYLLFPEGSVG
jgi:Tol biopolymer transport system component